MNKKGQLTILIIIGIILLFLILLFFTIPHKISKTNAPKYLSNQAFEELQSCIKKTTINAVYFNFLQGGYYNVPEPKIIYEPIEIPLYYNQEKTNIPDINTIENQLTEFIKNNLNNCIDKKNTDKIELTAIISKNNIQFDFKIPVTVQAEETTIQFEEFEQTLDIDFNKKHKNIQEFLNYQEKNKKFFPFSYLANLAYENNFKFEILEIDKNTKIISIIFDSLDERGDIAYNFALNYQNETDN